MAYLGRRRGSIILCAVLAGAGAIGVSYLQTPAYEAVGSIVFEAPFTDTSVPPSPGVSADDGPSRTPSDRFIRTQLKIVLSAPVRQKVRASLGVDVLASATAAPGADVIEVRGASSDPEAAADIANAYLNAYVEYRGELAVDEVLASRDRLRSQLTLAEQQIQALPEGERTTANAQLETVRTQLAELEAQASQVRDPAAVNPAEVPVAPASPQPIRIGLIALAGGLLLGIAVATIGELLDDSIKSKADFQRVFPDLPVLGLIPPITEWKSKDEAYTVCLSDPQSLPAETFRALRTSVLFVTERRALRSLLVTSAGVSEGKSTTAVNLAVACAAAGQKVVLAGCDLRRPRMHEFFDLSNDVGFTSVLLGKIPLSRALQEVPSQPRLFVLASGPLPPNPSELLASRRTGEVLRSLAADVDLLIIDSPPILAVTDALVLAEATDATLLVSVVGSTTRGEARRAVELLGQVEAPLIGAVLNGVRTQDVSSPA